MVKEYSPEELLPLSGIQHFSFCRRQWALIHIENQWHENTLTYEGRLLHEKVDDPYILESRGDIFISRSVPIVSYQLGLIGICDVIEFVKDSKGVYLPQKKNNYQPYPVEYKRGKPKHEPVDEIQLCAQAICLENMLSTEISTGYIYYGLTRHRETVIFSTKLRDLVYQISQEMHEYFSRKYIPKVKPSRSCRSCSLHEICQPEIMNKKESVSVYIQSYLENL